MKPARLLLFALLALLASCSSSVDPLAADAAAQFDVANNAIADLTAPGGDDVPTDELRQAVLRAQAAGTSLRVAVAAPGGEFVSAKSIVDRYGGTALSYESGGTTFEGASRDMTGSQLDRAIAAAKVEFDIGDSAAAFVDVIETEGLDERSAGFSSLLLWLLLAATLFMLWGAWSYLQARKRRDKRRRQFVERKAVLTDWAGQLGPEVEALRPLVAASPDNDKQSTWHDAQQFVQGIQSTIAEATTQADLDGAEMRIGRTAVKLRDLRKALS